MVTLDHSYELCIQAKMGQNYIEQMSGTMRETAGTIADVTLPDEAQREQWQAADYAHCAEVARQSFGQRSQRQRGIDAMDVTAKDFRPVLWIVYQSLQPEPTTGDTALSGAILYLAVEG